MPTVAQQLTPTDASARDLHMGRLTTVVRLVRRRPLRCCVALAIALSGVPLGIMLPSLYADARRSNVPLVVFPVVVIAVALIGIAGPFPLTLGGKRRH